MALTLDSRGGSPPPPLRCPGLRTAPCRRWRARLLPLHDLADHSDHTRAAYATGPPPRSSSRLSTRAHHVGGSPCWPTGGRDRPPGGQQISGSSRTGFPPPWVASGLHRPAGPAKRAQLTPRSRRLAAAVLDACGIAPPGPPAPAPLPTLARLGAAPPRPASGRSRCGGGPGRLRRPFCGQAAARLPLRPCSPPQAQAPAGRPFGPGLPRLCAVAGRSVGARARRGPVSGLGRGGPSASLAAGRPRCWAAPARSRSGPPPLRSAPSRGGGCARPPYG